jgi:hypothetical protein
MKRILNIYRYQHLALFNFELDCKKLKDGEIASYTTLSIRSPTSTVVYVVYTDSVGFRQRYLQGWIWDEINDYANISYEDWKYSLTRFLK